MGSWPNHTTSKLQTKYGQRCLSRNPLKDLRWAFRFLYVQNKWVRSGIKWCLIFKYLSAVISENFLGAQDINKFSTQSMLPSYLTPFTLNPVSSNLPKEENKNWNWWIHETFKSRFDMVTIHINIMNIILKIRQTYVHTRDSIVSRLSNQYHNQFTIEHK